MSCCSLKRSSVAFALFVVVAAASAFAGPPKNVIFMVGDGMGPKHVQAGGMYLNGSPGTLCFESFPHQAQVTTHSANASVTDSAAAGTAMATGFKVNNGVISIATPGDGRELQTLLEFYKAQGSRTGLVTCDPVTGATPGAFGAHEPSRDNRPQIAGDYLNQTRPNILLGGGANGLTPEAAIAAGYTSVIDRAGLLAIDTSLVSMLSGQFGTGQYMPYEYDGLGNLPHLSEMTITALDILDNDPNGFFVLVEGGNIDHAAHSNDTARMVYEVVEFHNTVQTAINWATGRTDTLIIVTADHETGGILNVQNNGQGSLPTVTWSSTGHTATNVGAYAWGMNAQYITGTLDNTSFFRIITGPDPIIEMAPVDIARTVALAHELPANTDSFTLRNSGLGSFSYTISSDASWVWAEPASGNCSTETDTIWLAYDVASLDPGTYVAHLSVTSTEAVNSPRVFTVNLIVLPAPGDFDSDSDVDQADFGHLQACLTGAAGSPAPDCSNADLTGNGRIDSADLAVFRGCMSGPGRPVDPYCAD